MSLIKMENIGRELEGARNYMGLVLDTLIAR